MTSLFESLGLRRKPEAGPEPTPEVLNQLELLVHSRKLGDAGACNLLIKMAYKGDTESVLSAISRIHCAGLRQPHFLTFATDYCIATRELDAAYRYAVSLRHDVRQEGEALFRMAYLAYLRGIYGTAISSFNEYLAQDPRSGDAHWFLGHSHLRQGSFRHALGCLSASGRIAAEDERWLSSVVANGFSRGRTDWYGARNDRLKRDLTAGWKESVLNASLRFKSRSLEDVDLWINGCQYVTDQRLFGAPGHWQTPAAMEANRVGDCEDLALWAWVQLIRQGVDARFVIGGRFSDEINHAWVQIHRQRRMFVFECTPMGVNLPIDAKSGHEYQPVISVDKSLSTYVHVPDWEEAWW